MPSTANADSSTANTGIASAVTARVQAAEVVLETAQEFAMHEAATLRSVAQTLYTNRLDDITAANPMLAALLYNPGNHSTAPQNSGSGSGSGSMSTAHEADSGPPKVQTVPSHTANTVTMLAGSGSGSGSVSSSSVPTARFFPSDSGSGSGSGSNSPPVADGGSFSVVHDRELDGFLSGSDPDLDPLTFSKASGPSHGSLSVNSDGSFTYTPNAGYVGSDSFTYTVSDGALTSAPGTVSIAVTDNAPVADGGSFSVVHDRELDGYVGGSDDDLDPLTASLVSGPTHGSLNFNNGFFTYTPDTHYVGSDSFQYKLNDGAEDSNVATVSINVTDNAPVADGGSFSVVHDRELDGFLSGSDADFDALTFSAASAPSHGSLSVHSDGSFTYTPTAGYIGSDSFTYTVSDGILTSDPATVTIDVTDQAPVAGGGSFSVLHDRELLGEVTGSDPDGDTLTFSVSSGPSNGSLSLGSDGSFTYTPTAGYVGSDSFTYTVSDGALTSDPATVTIDVTDQAPVADGGNFSVVHDRELNGFVGGSDADGDVLTASLVSGPSHGTLDFNDGSFTYTPDTHYVGSDSFQYKVNDGAEDSNVATVSIDVTNQAPVADGGSFSVMHDQELDAFVSGSDADGDALTFSAASGPSHGSLTLNSNGSFTYTPTAHWAGTDSFTYTVSDGILTSDPATVTITVTDNAPVANDDNYSVVQDQRLDVTTGGVLVNDSDLDGDKLTAVLDSGPSNGTLTLNSDGTFSYVPDAGFVGTDSFTYRASDGVLTSDPATVNIKVLGTVKGEVWLDNNGDGSLNDGEMGFSNIKVNLIRFDPNSPPGQVVATATTDDDGDFQFTVDPSVDGNQFEVQVILPDGDEATYKGTDSVIDDNGLTPVFALGAPEAQNIKAGARSTVVTTTQDDASGPIKNQITLRDAIETVNNGLDKPVTFKVNGTIPLQAELPLIARNMTIDGSGVSITVSGENSYRLLEVLSGFDLSINNLTLSNGNSSGAIGTNPDGGAILVDQNAQLDVSWDTFSGNEAMYETGANGGAIANLGTVNIFSNTTFADNTALGNGGAIENQGVLMIVGDAASKVAFNNNSAGGSGAAIDSAGGGAGATDIEWATFTNNTAQDGVGGAIATTDSLVVNNSSFATNKALVGTSGGTAGYGGAIANNSEVPMEVQNSSFTNNQAANNGGAIDTASATTISNDTFTTNSASGNGGAIDNEQATELDVSGSTFSGNTAGANGGAIDNEKAAPLDIDTSVFSGNGATGNGGAIENWGDLTVSSTTTIVSTFNNNTAGNNGGAIENFGHLNLNGTLLARIIFYSNTANTDGGAIDSNAASNGVVGPPFVVNVSYTGFYGNIATNGAGGAVNTADDAYFNGDDFASFADPVKGPTPNQAQTRGGAINATGGSLTPSAQVLQVTNSTFDSNKVNGQGGLGGATCTVAASNTITTSVFNGNLAMGAGQSSGGAIADLFRNMNNPAIATNAGLWLSQDFFGGNNAVRNGGAIYTSTFINAGQMQVSIETSTFWNNVAVNGDGGAVDIKDLSASGSGGASANFANDTFYKNTALSASGGAIELASLSVTGTVTASLTSLTVFDNTAGISGGGVDIGIADDDAVSFDNDILDGNNMPPGFAGPFDVSEAAAGEALDLGWNLLDPSDTAVLGDETDVINANPGLNIPLANNNALPGYQQTLSLAPGSPALGAGEPGLAGTIDERGYTRKENVSIGAEDPNAG